MKSIIKFSVLAVIVYLILPMIWEGSGRANAAPALNLEKLAGGYSIQVPSLLHVTHTNPAGDFHLYYLTDPNDDKTLLGIYIGNFPKKSSKDSARIISESSRTIGGFTATSAQWSCSGNQYCGEVYVKLLAGNGWPAFAHLFYRDLSKSELAMVERIIESFKKEPQ